MWNFKDYDPDTLVKILCWASIGCCVSIGLIQIFPFILWVIIIIGIVVPIYYLINKRKEE